MANWRAHRRRIRTLAAAFVVAATLLTGVTPAPADVEAASRLCTGVPPTAVLTRANRVCQLTPGNDVVCGSSGADMITTSSPDDFGGVDVISGNGGDDIVGVVSGEGSQVDGGSGRDIIVVVDGADATGGSGNDRLLWGCGEGTEVNGGSGNDAFAGDIGTIELELDTAINTVVGLGEGQYPCLFAPIPAPMNQELVLIVNSYLPQIIAYVEAAGGDAGAPSIWAFDGATGRGGSGNDAIWGFGGTAVKSDSGNDVVIGGLDSEFLGLAASIDCGSGRDWVLAPDSVPTNRCEQSGPS